MVRHRWKSVILALALLATTATPALGNDPRGERPLTREEERAAEQKLRQAERNLAVLDRAGGGGITTQACPTAQGGAISQQGGGAISPQASCPSVPSGFLTVEARDQVKWTYCGPAVGQVITNYVWAMGPGQNKYSQAQLAGWMRTDLNGGTNAGDLATGLNNGTNGSPRKPSGWWWVVIELRDRNANGIFGDDLHSLIRSNISVSRMPIVFSVKPHDPGAAYRLESWPRPVASVGHYIAGYGWRGLYNGTDSALVWYTDSSKDEGGSTGKFSDPVRHMTILILNHTRRLVW